MRPASGDGAFADYLTVNISSPNTPGLRDCRTKAPLDELLAAVAERAHGGPPVFLKVAPDLARGDPERIVRAALDHQIDALIVANTDRVAAGAEVAVCQ